MPREVPNPPGLFLVLLFLCVGVRQGVDLLLDRVLLGFEVRDVFLDSREIFLNARKEGIPVLEFGCVAVGHLRSPMYRIGTITDYSYSCC